MKLDMNLTGRGQELVLDLEGHKNKSNLTNVLGSMAHKARVMVANGHVFDIIAHDIDTDRVYTFGFNYIDEVLISITDIDGSYEEGTCALDNAIKKIKEMQLSELYNFEYIPMSELHLTAQG